MTKSNRSLQPKWIFYVKLICHRHNITSPPQLTFFSESELKYLTRLFGWAPLIKFMYRYYLTRRNITVTRMECWAELAEKVLRRNPDNGFPADLRRVRGRILKRCAMQLNQLEYQLRTARRVFKMRAILKTTGLGEYFRAMQKAGLKWQV